MHASEISLACRTFSVSAPTQTAWAGLNLFIVFTFRGLGETMTDVLFRHLGVCHADDLFYMWDMYGLNAELGLLDAWWSQANKINSKR